MASLFQLPQGFTCTCMYMGMKWTISWFDCFTLYIQTPLQWMYFAPVCPASSPSKSFSRSSWRSWPRSAQTAPSASTRHMDRSSDHSCLLQARLASRCVSTCIIFKYRDVVIQTGPISGTRELKDISLVGWYKDLVSQNVKQIQESLETALLKNYGISLLIF